MSVQAGPPLANLLGEAPAAPGQKEGILRGFHHLAHRKAAGEGADVLRPVLLLLQRRRDAGIFLFGDLHITVALVILQQDVVLGGVGLDLACFQHQRFELALADDHIKVEGMLDHLGDLGVVGNALPEILAHPGAQPLGLADVDDFIPLVPDDIDPRQQGQYLRLFVQFSLGHGRGPPLGRRSALPAHFIQYAPLWGKSRKRAGLAQPAL